MTSLKILSLNTVSHAGVWEVSTSTSESGGRGYAIHITCDSIVHFVVREFNIRSLPTFPWASGHTQEISQLLTLPAQTQAARDPSLAVRLHPTFLPPLPSSSRTFFGLIGLDALSLLACSGFVPLSRTGSPLVVHRSVFTIQV